MTIAIIPDQSTNINQMLDGNILHGQQIGGSPYIKELYETIINSVNNIGGQTGGAEGATLVGTSTGAFTYFTPSAATVMAALQAIDAKIGVLINNAGSSGAAGIDQIIAQCETEKLLGTKIPSNFTNAIITSFVQDDNCATTLNGSSSGATLTLNSFAAAGYALPKVGCVYRVVNTTNGVFEDLTVLTCTDTQVVATATLANTYPSGSLFARNWASYNAGNRDYEFLTVAGGGSASTQQNHTGPQIDVGLRNGAQIDWECRYNGPTIGLAITGSAIGTNTLYIASTTDRSNEFSSSAPANKVMLNYLQNDGANGLSQGPNTLEYTVTSSNWNSGSSRMEVQVSANYYQNGVAKTDGIAQITDFYTATAAKYWVISAKAEIPKISFVSAGVNESFVEVIPKKSVVKQNSKLLFTDNFNRTDQTGTIGNGWSWVKYNGNEVAPSNYIGISSGSLNRLTAGGAIDLGTSVYRSDVGPLYKYPYEIIFDFNFVSGSTNRVWDVQVAINANSNTAPSDASFLGTAVRFYSANNNLIYASMLKDGGVEYSKTSTSLAVATWNTCRVRIENGKYFIKYWAQSSTEPNTWNITGNWTYTPSASRLYTVLFQYGYDAANSRIDNLFINQVGQGLSLSGTELNKNGQFLTFKTDNVRTVNTLGNTLESKSSIATGGL